MKITIRKNEEEINSLEKWYKYAGPKTKERHWQPGRSALEFARFALSDAFTKFTESLLSYYNISEDYFICEPEALTPFEKGMGSGGPRNHDLLMISKNTVVGIEAKVSESFDKRLKAKRKFGGKNMNTRLNACLDFMHKQCPANAENLHYQLYSATIGTVIEAKKRGLSNAVVLFVVFIGDVAKERDYDKRIKNNNDAFIDFCKTFNLDEHGGCIPGIPGAPSINVVIKKVEVNIDDYNVLY